MQSNKNSIKIQPTFIPDIDLRRIRLRCQKSHDFESRFPLDPKTATLTP